jgi:hypothetical protein
MTMRAWWIVLALVACKSKDAPKQEAPAKKDAASAMAADASAQVAASDAAAADAEEGTPETQRLVDEAFGGKTPALPLLSSDGEVAAVDLSESIGLSDSSTYEVGFLGKKLDRVAVLDRKAASAIAEGQDPKLDRGALKKQADSVKQRTTGFTPFASVMEPEAINEAPPGSTPDSHAVTAGAATLEYWSGSGDALKLRLADAKGKQLSAESIASIAGSDAPGDCGGTPHLTGVWIDEPRKRVLLRVDYSIGGDACKEIPGTYRMWKLP